MCDEVLRALQQMKDLLAQCDALLLALRERRSALQVQSDRHKDRSVPIWIQDLLAA